MKTSPFILFLLLLLWSFNSSAQIPIPQIDTAEIVAPPPVFNYPLDEVFPEMWECGCDDEASFPGGRAELHKWIDQNKHYPLGAKELGIEGKVYVSFVVERDGSIFNIKMELKSNSYTLNSEAERLVSAMPLWHPGSFRGKPVRTRVRMSIKFQLI